MNSENTGTTLVEHFEWIYNTNESGTLKVQSSQGTMYIYFQNGFVQLVSSPQGKSVLGEGLRCCRGLEEETIEAIFERQRETGQSLVAVLQDFNLGDKTFIADLLLFQIAEEIYEIFTWPDPECDFTEGQAPPDIFDPELLKLNVALDSSTLMLQAARRIDEYEKIKAAFSTKDIPYLLKDQEQWQELPEEACELLALMDGVKDIEEILAQVRIPNFHGLKLISELAERDFVAFKTGEQLVQLAGLDAIRTRADKCLKLYERAEELGQSSVEITSWLAVAYESCGHKDKAAAQYKKLGEHCVRVELIPGAIRAYQKVVEFAPDDAHSNEVLIKLLYQTQRAQEAVQYSHFYARQLILAGDKQKAAEILQQANSQYLVVDNLALLAPLYMELGQNQAAGEAYEQLAKHYESEGDLERALDIYHKIINLDRENINARMALAEHLRKQDRLQDALEQYKAIGQILTDGTVKQPAVLIEVCKRILEQEPYALDARRWLIDTYIEGGNKTEALAHLQEMITMLERGDEDDPLIIDNLKKILELEPQNNLYRKRLAELYEKKEMKVEAVKTYLTYAYSTSKQGDHQESLWALDRVIALDPHNLKARTKRARIFFDLREKEEGFGEKAFNEYKLVGYLCKGAGMYDAAVDAFVKVLKLQPHQEQQWYLEIGEVYQEKGALDKAVKSYQKYAQRSLSQHNLGEAQATCQRILSLVPNDEIALKINAEVEYKMQMLGQTPPPPPNPQLKLELQNQSGTPLPTLQQAGTPLATLQQVLPLPSTEKRQTPLPSPLSNTPAFGGAPPGSPMGLSPNPAAAASPGGSSGTPVLPVGPPGLGPSAPGAASAVPGTTSGTPGLTPTTSGTGSTPPPGLNTPASMPTLSLGAGVSGGMPGAATPPEPPGISNLAEALEKTTAPASEPLAFVDDTPVGFKAKEPTANSSAQLKAQLGSPGAEKKPAPPAAQTNHQGAWRLITMLVLAGLAGIAYLYYANLATSKKIRKAPAGHRTLPFKKYQQIKQEYQRHPEKWRYYVQELKELVRQTRNRDVIELANQLAQQISTQGQRREQQATLTRESQTLDKLIKQGEYAQGAQLLQQLRQELPADYQDKIGALEQRLSKAALQGWQLQAQKVAQLCQHHKYAQALALLAHCRGKQIATVQRQIEQQRQQVQKAKCHTAFFPTVLAKILPPLYQEDYQSVQGEIAALLKETKLRQNIELLKTLQKWLRQEESLKKRLQQVFQKALNHKIALQTIDGRKLQGTLVRYYKSNLYIQGKQGGICKLSQVSPQDLQQIFNRYQPQPLSKVAGLLLVIAVDHAGPLSLENLKPQERDFLAERLAWSRFAQVLHYLSQGDWQKSQQTWQTLTQIKPCHFTTCGREPAAALIMRLACQLRKSGRLKYTKQALKFLLAQFAETSYSTAARKMLAKLG